ncbi:MAG: hypothetical protein AAFX86_05860 [Pseudomonadota bacterium]
MKLTTPFLALACLLLPACATAQTAPMPVPQQTSSLPDQAPEPIPSQALAELDLPELNPVCARQMTELAGGTLSGRHQLFVLVREAGRGADDDVLAALEAYGAGTVDPETPILQVVEDIANPVLLQAAPNATVGQMAHLIRFSRECDVILDGQIKALEATSPDLASGTYKQAIGEDAMFLRSMLLDALYRLNADRDAVHGQTVAAYQRDLVRQRDDIEFAAFDAELAALEDEFAGDLGDRLDLAKTSADETAEAVDAKGAAEVARALTDVQRAEANARMAQMLAEILNDYSYGYP